MDILIVLLVLEVGIIIETDTCKNTQTRIKTYSNIHRKRIDRWLSDATPGSQFIRQDVSPRDVSRWSLARTRHFSDNMFP